MPTRDRSQLLLALPVVLAVAIAVLVVRTWAARVGHPYDLEWMEGGVLAHAWRALHGEPIYVPPGPDFIPMVYTPGYYWVVAAVGAVTGLSPAVGRSVSIAGTVLACLALVWGARRRLGRPWLGLVGVGVFLGTYDSNGAFFDLVRPDALAVGLSAWALVLATEERRAAVAASALLLFLAFVVKHNTAALGLPMALGLLVHRGWRDTLLFVALSAIPGAVFTQAMQLSTHGHFLRYVIDVPRSHPLVWDRVVPGTVRELGHAMPVVAIAVAVWLAWVGVRRAPRIPAFVHVGVALAAAIAGVKVLGDLPPVQGIAPATSFEATAAYVLVAVGVAVPALTLLGQAWERRRDGAFVYGAGVALVIAFVAGLMRGHHGGFVNVFMPLHWVLSALFVVMLADLVDVFPGWPGAVAATTAATLATATQLAALDLDRLRPTPADVEAGDAIVEALRGLDGPVLSVFAPWMPVQAGHAPGFHLIALWDINHPDGPYVEAFHEIQRAVNRRHWATILDGDPSMGHGVPKVYHRERVFGFPPRVLMPRTGWRRRPEVIWTAPERGARPEGG